MTKHLEELEEISRLRLGIILLIKELDKHREYNQIKHYLKDLVEGVDENTVKEKQANFEKFMKALEKEVS